MTFLIKKLALFLKPDYMFDRVEDISTDILSSDGIKGMIIDLDNTLIPWKESKLPQSSIDWVQKMQLHGLKLFILSNTVNVKRLKNISKTLNVDYLHPAAKPNRASFTKASNILQLASQEIAVVGDQLFTDILGGKKSNMKTILIKPISNKEFIGTKIISRNFEKILKKYM